MNRLVEMAGVVLSVYRTVPVSYGYLEVPSSYRIDIDMIYRVATVQTE